MALDINFTFDDKTYRHYMNGFLSVLHCHHYMSLLTKTAMETDNIGGIKILMESAEDAVRPLFDDYIQKNSISDPTEKMRVGVEYYSVMGMGKMVARGNDKGGEVELSKSHVDQGWLMKFGKSDKPLNFFTCGYIAALFGAAFGKPARSYRVTEIASIATGEATSKFTVTLN